jgi:methylmalonyl-CoA mutase
VDNAKVRAGQIERIERVRASRDELQPGGARRAPRRRAQILPGTGEGRREAVEGASRPQRGDAPSTSAAGALHSPFRGGSNLLALAVEAARARCTLGEISAALEDVFGRYDTVPAPVSGIYGGAY